MGGDLFAEEHAKRGRWDDDGGDPEQASVEFFLREGVSAVSAEVAQNNVVEAKAEEYRQYSEYGEA